MLRGPKRVVVEVNWWISVSIGDPNHRLPGCPLHAMFRIVCDVPVPSQLPTGARGRAIDELFGLTGRPLLLRRGGPTNEHRQCCKWTPPSPCGPLASSEPV